MNLKKTMAAGAAALCAAVCLADVQSSNVVGYETLNLLANDYTMFGMNFEAVDGGSVTLKDLKGNFFGGPTMAEGDNILLWKEDGYHNYYFGYWGDPEYPDWDNVWYDDGDNDASDVEIGAGRACWYLRRADASSLTISGGVKLTPTTVTLLANDYTMFSNPYPSAIALKDLKVTAPFGGPTMAEGDNLLIWLADGYHNYYYGYWGDPEYPDWDNVWYDDGDNDASDVTIDSGVACWYLRRSDATTMSFVSPLAK